MLWLENLARDVRYSIRSLLQSPGSLSPQWPR